MSDHYQFAKHRHQYLKGLYRILNHMLWNVGSEMKYFKKPKLQWKISAAID